MARYIIAIPLLKMVRFYFLFALKHRAPTLIFN